MEQQPVRIEDALRIELPEEVLEEMRRVPASDICAECKKQLDFVSLPACLPAQSACLPVCQSLTALLL